MKVLLTGAAGLIGMAFRPVLPSCGRFSQRPLLCASAPIRSPARSRRTSNPSVLNCTAFGTTSVDRLQEHLA